MENKFKEGDLVECINNDSASDLTLNKQYVVLSTSSGGYIMIQADDGEDIFCFNRRFKLVKQGQNHEDSTKIDRINSYAKAALSGVIVTSNKGNCGTLIIPSIVEQSFKIAEAMEKKYQELLK